MILKITLTHAIEGSIEIPAPDGWKGAEVGLERDPDLGTLAPYLKSPFNAYGEFRTWCLLVEKNHGPDAIITAKIRYAEEERGMRFQELFPNSDIEIAVGSFTETVGHELGHGLEYGFVLKSFWAKLQQRFETPVDVQSATDLDGNAVEVLAAEVVPQTPQIIDMGYQSELSNTRVLTNPTWQGSGVLPTRTITSQFDDQWLQFSYEEIIAELQRVFELPIDFNPELPVGLFVPEYAGEYRIRSRQLVTFINGGEFFSPGRQYLVDITDLTDRSIINFFYQKNSEAPVQFGAFTNAIDLIGGIGEASAFDLDVTLDLVVGDQVRIFGKFDDEITVNSFSANDGIGMVLIGKNLLMDLSQMGGAIDGDEATLGTPDTDIPYSYISIDGKTVFIETTAEGFTSHDLLAAAIKRVCGAEFYSEVLGSPNTLARQYDYVGCAANFMHYKGLQLRQYLLSEKPFFASVKDIWNGINPVHCLAMGVDRIDGVDVVRVWKRSELYDETRVSATFDNVRDISRSYDQEEFFALVRAGYEKGFLQDVASIDDPQTMRDYATILKKIGKKIEIISTMIGASLAFEITRRFTKMKSADHQFDNEIFIQAVRLNGEYGFIPDLGEGISDVTNLLNEETRYNKNITSARNLLRWLDYLSGCLQAYPASVFKFTGGEGNYDMQATMAPNACGDDFGGNPLSEKQDIPISQNYLFWPVAYTIKSKISFGQWLQIVGDMHAAIKVSQSDTGHMPFFTKNLTVTLSEAQMTLIAWPKRFFPLQIVQNNDTEHERRTGRKFDDTFGPQFN